MTEPFIMSYIPQRIKQLGYTNYHLRYRDLLIEKETTINITAWNQLYFIVDDPQGLIVQSDYGVYDSTDCPASDNMHQHRGKIVIQNPDGKQRRIKFIQVIIVN